MKKLLRTNKVTMMLNDAEMRVVNTYCERYKVANRSKLIRETLIRAILQKMDEDNPTLF